MKEALEQWASTQPPTISHHSHHHHMSNESNTPKENKPDNYNDIKARYLRSLNIPIPLKRSSSKDLMIAASAPIPIPISMSRKSDDEEEEDRYDSEEELKPRRIKPPKEDRPKNFIPPHQLVNQDSAVVNHSVPSNYRRRTRGI